MKKQRYNHHPLLFADSVHHADQLYFSRFFVPDPFISFGAGSKKYAVLSPLEIGRGEKESDFDEILPLDEWKRRAKELFDVERPGAAEVIAAVAHHFRITGFMVSDNFPLAIARRLEEGGLRIEIAYDGLFPEREKKNEAEVAAIRRGNRCAAAGIRAAEKALTEARIKGGKLIYHGKALTSERLKEIIEIACLQAGGVAGEPIAAGGEQACDPHCTGSGPLRANQLIIIDVFPRMKKDGYHGDMTRTFLKGTPSDRQKELLATVLAAQKEAVQKVKANVSAGRIHDEVVSFFEGRGFSTTTKGSAPEGFFHGTGHGLGLEVHESPRVSSNCPKLKAGQVVTVEPGLYYPGVGGARIEDVVRVTGKGPELLSRYHYRWRIS